MSPTLKLHSTPDGQSGQIYQFLDGFTPVKIAMYVVAFTLLVVINQLWLHPIFISPLRKAPGPPFGHPLWGQFPKIIKAEAGIQQRAWAKEYGPKFRAVGPLGIERMHFLNTNALQKILASEWLYYPRPDFMRDILGLVAGYGLLTVSGNEHKQMRRAMNPAFSINNLSAQTDMYYESIETLIKLLSKETDEENSRDANILIHPWMSKVTLDIICITAFGYYPNSLTTPDNELAEAYERLIDMQNGPNIARLAAIVSIPWMPTFLQSELAFKYRHWFPSTGPLQNLYNLVDCMYHIKQVSRKMLEEKVRESAAFVEDSSLKKDIMSLLVRARMNEKGDGYKMSDRAMMDQVLTFLGAGHETTASGLTWTLWLLAKGSAAQDKLRAEVLALVSQNPRPDYRSLNELPYLHSVVMESLRILPPVPMTFRKAAKSDYIDDIWVPKGTILYIPIRVVNTWKEIWGEDAEEFRPERWNDLPEDYNPNLHHLSFIAGPHACIGKTMSIIEMKAILAVLISHFAFEPAYKDQVEKPTAAITMKPADGMPLKIRRVNKIPLPE